MPSCFSGPRARYGRVVPKNKFYEQGVSPKVRGRFVSEVNRIRWAYKLAEETIQLSGNDSVPEIQVFEIETRCDDVSDDVLQALDTAVPYPVIIEISRRNRDQPQTRMTACYKDLGKTKPNLSGYFTSGWIAEPAGAYRCRQRWTSSPSSLVWSCRSCHSRLGTASPSRKRQTG